MKNTSSINAPSGWSCIAARLRQCRTWAWLMVAATMFSNSFQHMRAQETNLKSDEDIVFYPSVAQRVPGETNLWRATIRGRVFEVENWRLLIGAFRRAVELRSDQLTPEENAIFTNRARLFLVDNERRKNVYVRFGPNVFFVGRSGSNGRFSGEILFTANETNEFAAVLPDGDDRQFAARIFPLENEGVSVISDIDDTIKITEVRDKRATLRNTFLREFQVVPGMPEFYQQLAQIHQATFHYISASPWQLYEPLAMFTAAHHFPPGTFELKQFRWKDRSFFSLFADPERYKIGVIEPFLRQFPNRKFILIGDSGERDPEVYGALARKFPQQILKIYIRDVTEESPESERYRKAFRDLPPEQWEIFSEPPQAAPQK